jgi:hypothetical protein
MILKRLYSKSALTVILIYLLHLCLYRFSPSSDEIAENTLSDILFELRIERNLFNDPILIEEGENYSIYQSVSKVPNIGDAVLEYSIGKSTSPFQNFTIKGKRKSLLCYRNTLDYPFKEAMLVHLFSLSASPRRLSENDRHFIQTPLSITQMETIADILEIKYALMEYYFVNSNRYPDNLNELNLDRMYITDEFGDLYIYDKLDEFVLLGTWTDNNELDYDENTLSEFYWRNERGIITFKNDILVKFKPIYM